MHLIHQTRNSCVYFHEYKSPHTILRHECRAVRSDQSIGRRRIIIACEGWITAIVRVDELYRERIAPQVMLEPENKSQNADWAVICDWADHQMQSALIAC